MPLPPGLPPTHTRRLSYAERKKARSLHLRNDSSGSVHGAFYASSDEDAPNKHKRPVSPRRQKKETVSQFLTDRSDRGLEPILDVLGDSSSSFATNERTRRARDSLQYSGNGLDLSAAEIHKGGSEVDSFAALAMADYSTMAKTTAAATSETLKSKVPPAIDEEGGAMLSFDWMDEEEDDHDLDWKERLTRFIDPTEWLLQDSIPVPDSKDVHFDENRWTLQAFVRLYFYNPIDPEFTSVQQFCWAVIIGMAMGFFVSFWKWLLEAGVDFLWETVPEFLLEIGVFTELDGAFPLYHYCWICPAIWGGILSWIFVVYPMKIPDQNQWITAVHNQGVLDSSSFMALFVLSTLAMLSGLSLGPELPLVLTAGMAGSWFALLTKQSMLQARVLNLTAASAAVGGFFGFPMAGALFVLEIPHRMGLQYFEALSPATIASIVAVLTNRLVVGNDVTGYFHYPFLSTELPSRIFTSALFYGVYGAGIGFLYGKGAVYFKGLVHDFFHAPHDSHDDEHSENGTVPVLAEEEQVPLVPTSENTRMKQKKTHVVVPTISERIKAFGCIFIKEEPKRAALAGVLAGAIVGLIGMYVPHTLFWGEAQLQNLIDKGRTPLPVFGQGDDPTAALTAMGYCMIDPNDPEAVQAGFSVGCSLLIAVTKTVTIGLSLGTGIIGGHFWGPLFVGCSASHLLTDLVDIFSKYTGGYGKELSAYPCVVILCTMGSAHVVTYRAHMAIMLILTLTISTFDPENETNSAFSVAGDYSAVFPLLVVSVFVALMTSKGFVFYNAQRSRGDITAVPEVLCEPGMEGRPKVINYEPEEPEEPSFGPKAPSDELGALDMGLLDEEQPATNVRTIPESITQNEIEKAFEQKQAAHRRVSPSPPHKVPSGDDVFTSNSSALSSARLDELLGQNVPETISEPPKLHRRTLSAPVVPPVPGRSNLPMRDRTESGDSTGSQGNRERANSRGNLVRIDSYGKIEQYQPSLLDQARGRSASSASESRHRRVASVGRGAPQHRRVASGSATAAPTAAHRRHPSLPTGRPPTSRSRSGSSDNGSVGSSQSLPRQLPPQIPQAAPGSQAAPSAPVGGPLSLDDIEQSFNSMTNSAFLDALRNS